MGSSGNWSPGAQCLQGPRNSVERDVCPSQVMNSALLQSGPCHRLAQHPSQCGCLWYHQICQIKGSEPLGKSAPGSTGQPSQIWHLAFWIPQCMARGRVSKGCVCIWHKGRWKALSGHACMKSAGACHDGSRAATLSLGWASGHSAPSHLPKSSWGSELVHVDSL